MVEEMQAMVVVDRDLGVAETEVQKVKVEDGAESLAGVALGAPRRALE